MDITEKLHGYVRFVGKDYINLLYSYAKPLKGKRAVMINSTKDGGGVAELLMSVVPCFEELGIATSWLELKAPYEFFSVTKAFHNALQGESIDSLESKIHAYENFYRELVEEFNRPIIETLNSLSSSDFVIIHDPQPLALVNYRKKDGSKWLWRNHIDTTKPNKELWQFVYNLASRYDLIITSKKNFIQGDSSKYKVIHPSIDPLTDKNRDMSTDEIMLKFEQYSIPIDKPIVLQVSRFDKWKDPMGVIEAYHKVREKGVNCSLVMLGHFASDDPEGPALYEQMMDYKSKHACGDDIYLISSHDPLLVNALQRTARVVLQKSLREGFALTVSEALWKCTPVIATDIGGIPLQIQHNKNGYLVECYDIDENGQPISSEERDNHISKVAHYICKLVSDSKMAEEMGEHGKEHVRNNFLITRKLKDYLELFNSLTS